MGRFWLLAVALAGTALLLAGTASADHRYHSDGAYLNYAQRPSPANGFGAPFDARYEIAKGGRGLAEVINGETYFASVNDALYGLWYFTRYVESGRRTDLRQAERAARWLRRKQDPATGIYPTEYRYDLGGREDGSDHLVLEPGWYGSNAQGIPLSLLSRLYRATGDRVYLREARLALRPLALPKGAGGVQAPFLDTERVFFEGYATLGVPVHTLSHHVQTLVGLYDFSALSDSAARLFRKGMATLRVALPHYDLPADRRTLAWLAGITDPPRPQELLIGYYQEAMVVQLRALDSVSPDSVVRHYEAAWRAQLPEICVSEIEGCYGH